MLLILDLDETLVHSADASLDRPSDFRVGPFEVYKRPYVEIFFRHIFQLFEHVAVWTSGSECYGQELVKKLFPDPSLLSFVWCASRCTYVLCEETQSIYPVKDLKKVKRMGFSLQHTLMIDDTPRKLERNYGNIVPIRPYWGELIDCELLYLLSFLNELSDAKNVRTIEKRFWRDIDVRHKERVESPSL